jgi:conjugal transfer/entry exclusion protein
VTSTWRLEAGVATLVVAVALASAWPSPARAQFSIPDLGGSGGGEGCASAMPPEEAEGWLEDIGGIAGPLEGTTAGVDPARLLGDLGDLGSLLEESLTGFIGDASGRTGCASELTQLMNNVQLAYAVLQQARMLEPTGFSLTGGVTAAMVRVKRLLRMSEKVLYEVDPALARHEEVYPEEYPEIGAEIVLRQRQLQNEELREAGIAALATSAGIAEENESLEALLEETSKASLEAEGQTAAIQAGTQAGILTARVLADVQSLLQAQGRQEQAQRDAQAAGEVLARAYTRHLWRNVPDGFAGGGSRP